ncbi:MAG: ATP-binding protein [Candidatus Hydrogenedentota bacterium]|nr:MAG: ATP-binding protein [Candidatus Hydrogenedentota bacterium]
METISLSIPSVPRLLRVVRCTMAEVAELAGFPLKDRDKICLAVDEACSNIIRHSYKGRPDGQIILRCKLESNKITISIRDFGEKFDSDRVRPPDLEKVKPGGLGIHMIRSVMDKVEYDCSHEVGTEIHMTKYVHPVEARNGGSH